MSMEEVFKVTVVVFTVANLAAMGLELKVREANKTFRNLRFPGLTLLWGWIVGPILALLITRVLPLAAVVAWVAARLFARQAVGAAESGAA